MAPKGSILITGANGGLGSATVDRILHQSHLAKDYYGIYTVRKVETADAVKKVLNRAASAQHAHELLVLDLASLAGTRRVAEAINRRVASGELPPIRALILNAGYQEHDTHNFTNDGFDMSFQANFLSHFLLTLLLLQSLDKEHGRIVVIGSWTHEYDPAHRKTNAPGGCRLTFTYSTADPRNKIGPFAASYTPKEYHQIFSDPIDIESIAKGKWAGSTSEDGLNGFRRYGAGKLCEVMML